MSKVQERVAPASVFANNHSFQTVLNHPPNAISTNREGTQCVVGGRNLLKVFHIEEKRFSERVNLVVGPQTLNYSIVDVQWHPLEENLIASAAGNGVVILWDLNKVNELKRDHIFRQHYRYVTKLCFHPTESSLLMSCSHDGNINCFDIRKKDVAITFNGRTDSIRDVQFHPFDKHLFCAACDSGAIQFWDTRRPEQYHNHFTAHGGPTFTLNWHPEERNWIATGGRDQSIKIWDTKDTNLKGQPLHVIHTFAPIHRVKWRPTQKYQIASCAFVLDNNLNIWDVRRPYIPFAAFQEAKEAVTGIIWRKDADVMLACSKDKHIYYHVMADAERPADHQNPVGLSVSPQGFVAHSFPSSLQKSMKSKAITSYPITPIKKAQSVSHEFKTDCSVLRYVKAHIEMEEDYIARLAKKYKFHGMPFVTICDHNAKVSEEENFSDKAGTWFILKQLYSDEVHEKSDDSSQVSEVSDTLKESFTRKLETPESFSDANTATQGLHSSSSDDERSGLQTPGSMKRLPKFIDQTLVGPELDAVFHDDYNTSFYTAELHGAEDEQIERLPNEAFQLRQQLNEKTIQAIKEPFDDFNGDHKQQNAQYNLKVSHWEYESIVQDMLYYYAEQGDVQMAVTVLLTLRTCTGKDLIDLSVQEEWFHGYLELLYRFRLFNIATEIINHAPIPVNSLNQNSTTVNIQCGNCEKLIITSEPSWYCKSCRNISQLCSICHVPVKGLYVWCQGCGHGGHLFHLKDWFEKRTTCPTGCGHHCQYS